MTVKIQEISRKKPPKASWRFVAQNIRRIRGDRMGIFDNLVSTYGDAAAIRLGPVLLHVFNRPEHCQHILQTNQKNYVKDRMIMEPVELFSGQTMFTSDGDSWLKKRRLMQPAFHRRRLSQFGKTTTNAAENMLSRWRAEKNQPLDMQIEMARVTLEVVGQALFSTDLTDEATKLGEAFMVSNDYIIYRIDIPFAPPLWVPTQRNLHFKKAKKIVDNFLYQLIETRLSNSAQSEKKDDLMTMLIEARDEETGEGMSKEQIRNELISLFSAGHDTTASTLMWTLYLLSQHPEAEARLVAEIDAVLRNRPPTFGDLESLTYSRQVIDETLRLYPPAWALTRTAVSDDTVGEWEISAGQQVTLSVAAMHRHPKIWEDPNKFRPERFDPDHKKTQHKFAYLPFGGGSRMCIGNSFALSEATLIIATIMQQLTVKLIPGHKVETKTVAGLHSRYGMPMTLHWR